MTRIKASTEAKASAVGSGAAIIGAYAASVLTAKYQVPLEVAAAVVGVVAHTGSQLVRWIGRLVPSRRDC